MYKILVRTLFFSDCNGSLISVFAQNYELLDTWIVSEILSSLPFLGADGGVGGGEELGFVEGQGRFIIIII